MSRTEESVTPATLHMTNLVEIRWKSKKDQVSELIVIYFLT